MPFVFTEQHVGDLVDSRASLTTPPAPIDTMWLVQDPADTQRGEPPVTADERFAKLLAWASVDDQGRHVSPQRPSLNDFGYQPGGPRNAYQAIYGKLPVEDFAMVHILTHATMEIAVARYQKYKKMLIDITAEKDRLGKLYGIDESKINMNKDNETPDQKRFFSLVKRIRALKDVRREALRRIISINKTLGYTPDSLVHDQEDRLAYEDVMRRTRGEKDADNRPKQFSGAFLENRSRVGFPEDKPFLVKSTHETVYKVERYEPSTEEPPAMDEPIENYNPVDRLREFSAVLTEILTDFSGNDDLKDAIYADIISYLHNGKKTLDVYRNYIFMGPSGVGKTTWADFMGKLYKSLGIYMYGTVSVTTASDYIGAYTGWSGPQTEGVLDGNLENIVLIDEAYSLVASGDNIDGSGNYGDEAVTAIVNYMDKNKGCLMIILAGYEDKMKNDFLANNEGLDRRFPNKFVLQNYSSALLTHMLKKRAVKLNLPFPWTEQVWMYFERLIEYCRSHDERRTEAKKDLSITANEFFAAPFYDAWFSKQAGSIENIAAKMNIYCSIPEKAPPVHGRNEFQWLPDMMGILASLLDTKYYADIKAQRGVVWYVLTFGPAFGQRPPFDGDLANDVVMTDLKKSIAPATEAYSPPPYSPSHSPPYSSFDPPPPSRDEELERRMELLESQHESREQEVEQLKQLLQDSMRIIEKQSKGRAYPSFPESPEAPQEESKLLL